jgi:hypothetical protein
MALHFASQSNQNAQAQKQNGFTDSREQGRLLSFQTSHTQLVWGQLRGFTVQIRGIS